MVSFGTELIVSPTGEPVTREEVRNAPLGENLEQAGEGVGYQIIDFTNVIG